MSTWSTLNHIICMDFSTLLFTAFVCHAHDNNGLKMMHMWVVASAPRSVYTHDRYRPHKWECHFRNIRSEGSLNIALFTVPVYQLATASDPQLHQILQLFYSVEVACRILKHAHKKKKYFTFSASFRSQKKTHAI